MHEDQAVAVNQVASWLWHEQFYLMSWSVGAAKAREPRRKRKLHRQDKVWGGGGAGNRSRSSFQEGESRPWAGICQRLCRKVRMRLRHMGKEGTDPNK